MRLMSATYFKVIAFLVTLSLFVSCNRYEDDFAEIRNEISAIKETLREMQAAYDAGKIITSVEPVEEASSGDWLITFSDNSTIKITSGKDGENGLDGITPYLKINEANRWVVSYDGGNSCEVLLDSAGRSIPATGFSVRVTVNDEGYYVFETYDSNTSEAVDSILTPYCSKKESAIKSIVENQAEGTITITMQSGDVYTFRQMHYYPSSIVLFKSELSLEHGARAFVEFRVNPSNAFINIDDIHLDLVETETRSSVSYITPPTSYSIESITKSLDENGNVKRGQYILTIKDNETGKDYSDKVAIVIATKDNQGEPMEISSNLISISSVYPSSLPRVFITTPNKVAVTSKTHWLNNTSIRVIDENGEECLNVKTSIKGRGNTTWSYPKKPYALRLYSESEVLGMPKHKRWVLLANWLDRTLLRNDVSFEMARRVMDWAPRGRYVELYFNTKHLGNYYLCEQIKIDEERVDIGESDGNSDFSDPSLVTGGYILEYDIVNPKSGDVNYFYTDIQNYPVTIKDPDGEVITSSEHPGFLYVKNYINSLEKMFEEDKDSLSRWKEITSLIDIKSFVDWWLIHELANNSECYWPKSCYMYKKRDGKLYAGPVWDFDYLTYTSYKQSSLIAVNALYYKYLFKYPDFKLSVKERWAELKDTFTDMDNYILQQKEYIRESNEVNIVKWPITTVVNKDEELSLDEAVGKMRSAFKYKLSLVGNYISYLK